ncbi:hypothetical protein A0H81_00585 [Grifola frondosa]|uniref:Uncharacterized protein n=1 Tax=Grifola frondosa TaxID=5627 RepID=A0A1C7MSV7_GRIFR|nr:hypothetical protein A0H81_00585 [Grifola frondosa]
MEVNPSIRACKRICSTARSRHSRCLPLLKRVRHYAQVGSTTYVGEPPSPPNPPLPSTVATPSPQPSPLSTAFDARILSELSRRASSKDEGGEGFVPCTELLQQYNDNAGRVLDLCLPYESRPAADRRATFRDDHADIAMVVHAAQDAVGHAIVHASGFALRVPGAAGAVFATCAHTSCAARSSARRTGSSCPAHLLSLGPRGARVPPRARGACVPRPADLLILDAAGPAPNTLPVSPYPVHPGTRIRAHFVSDAPPEQDGWTPWLGGTWSRWMSGTVVGYRDFAGREAKPGTYDALSHMHFDPPPTPGSSGGPIVDEESGAVIGVMLGTQMVNRLEGVRGWGVPAETIFEMFSLPGLKLKNQG